MSKIMALVASKGKNAELAQRFSELANEMGIETELVNLVELELPLYATGSEKEGIPNQIIELTKRMADSQSLAFFAPEYNGSFPPVLNNAIAWMSLSDKDWRVAFNGKLTLIATHSGGGGTHALMAMRMQLAYCGANVIGRQIVANNNRPAQDESLKACIQQLS